MCCRERRWALTLLFLDKEKSGNLQKPPFLHEKATFRFLRIVGHFSVEEGSIGGRGRRVLVGRYYHRVPRFR